MTHEFNIRVYIVLVHVLVFCHGSNDKNKQAFTLS